MKTKLKSVTLALLAYTTLHSPPSTAHAQGTAFGYQGRLNNGTNAANGLYDFAFALFNEPSAGSQVGNTFSLPGVGVTNGLFTVALDFGPGVFTGPSYWLSVNVRSNGATSYATLSPLQPILPTPYASYAPSAGVANAVSASAVVLGQSLQIGTNNSLTGSYATITGGGNNNASGDYATVAGGAGNTVSSNAATVGGGSGNLASGDHAVVGGGEGNNASGTHAFVGGGWGNIAASDEDAVVGGIGNLATGDPSFIGSGQGNKVGTDTLPFGSVVTATAIDSWIGAGLSNNVQGNYAGIGGGTDNYIQTNATYSFIGGGAYNSIQTSAIDSAVGGGGGNNIQAYAFAATIGGGNVNTIQANAFTATISGGSSNTVRASASAATIAGGQNNTVSTNATVGGGYNNQAATFYSTIPGGQQAVAPNFAQLAYSSGAFANPGDSQYSLYVLRGTTLTNTVTSLYLNSSGAGEIALPTNRVCAFTASIVGVETASGSSHRCVAFHVRGVANGYLNQADDWDNDPNTGVPVGISDEYSTPASFSQAYWQVPGSTTPNFSVSGGKLHVQVTGEPSSAMRWTATIQTTEEVFTP